MIRANLVEQLLLWQAERAHISQNETILVNASIMLKITAWLVGRWICELRRQPRERLPLDLGSFLGLGCLHAAPVIGFFKKSLIKSSRTPKHMQLKPRQKPYRFVCVSVIPSNGSCLNYNPECATFPSSAKRVPWWALGAWKSEPANKHDFFELSFQF
jgi:hypothetical protein